ncbi:hypothetical protein QJQ45_015727 [Haematococcus lacustris]|nr:hypothetical protein QJQ45_015727 [Haematococcus lacustris]
MLRGTASCSCPQHSATQVPLISAASHRSTRRRARQSFSSNAYSVSVPPFVKNSPVRPSAIATKATQYVGSVVSDPACKYAVVVARFNDLVTKQLLDGALSLSSGTGCKRSMSKWVAWVPGSFELPLVAKSMAMSGKYHAVVAIGAVIQGATTHYDAVVSAATSGILNAASHQCWLHAAGVPIVFGVLTTDSLEQLDPTSDPSSSPSSSSSSEEAGGISPSLQDARLPWMLGPWTTGHCSPSTPFAWPSPR